MATSAIASAQTAPPVQPPPTRFHTTLDASGTLLYGAASQRLVAGSIGTVRADKQYELRFDLQSAYGDTRDQASGHHQIIARNSRVSTAYDLHPHNRVSPFAFASAETNYQQRFQSRVAAGTGAKLTLWRPDSVLGGFVQDASISLAVLGENTQALRDASEGERDASGGRVRWSLRLRYRKRIDKNLRFSHITLYQPAIDRPSRYTLESVTELAVPVRTQLQLTLSHRQRLDSEARNRGATSIQDGQVLFGVRATF